MNRFGRHIREHSKTQDTSTHAQDLGFQFREETSRAAAMAVILDLRTISFAENQEGIAQYAKSVFTAGQTVPHGVEINPKSNLSTSTATVSSLSKIIDQ